MPIRKKRLTTAARLDKLTAALIEQGLTIQAQECYLSRMFRSVLLLGNLVSRIYDRAGIGPALMIGLLDQAQSETDERYQIFLKQLAANPGAFIPPSATDTAWLAGALEGLKRDPSNV